MRNKIACMVLALGFSVQVGLISNYGAFAAADDVTAARLAAARQAYDAAGQSGRVGAIGANPTARMVGMPSMPGLAGSGIGATQTANLPSGPVLTAVAGKNSGGDYTRCPDGTFIPVSEECKCRDGTPMPADGKCDNGRGPGACPDGSDPASEYGIDSCMDDLLSCVNSGVLPNNINDLYNSDMRNAIMNGMNLCAPQVDACIANAKKNCKSIYHAASDVWIDFNSRVIQPNYYSFVLRKTGLTPNQAENTCWLLDKNTYGTSFSAVDNGGSVTNEYNNSVTAYNGLGDTKDMPQGAQVNVGNPGVDGSRGHYARWDATTGECLVRVAAYNGNNMITNKWLFGALGDDKAAEAWKPAGSSFACGKSLFEFSLLNNTSTAAVVGIGGGTLVGAGVGALAGHGNRMKINCADEGDRKDLLFEIQSKGQAGAISQWLPSKSLSQTTTNKEFTEALCKEVVGLQDFVSKAENDPCYKMTNTSTKKVAIPSGSNVTSNVEGTMTVTVDGQSYTLNTSEINVTESNVTSDDFNIVVSADGSTSCAVRFQNLFNETNGLHGKCGIVTPCVGIKDFSGQIKAVKDAVDLIDLLEIEENNRLTTTLVGAGIGAGVGGLVTGITYFVERNQISCRIGDGLDRVMYNKTGKIDSLKDFYVKWNLKLPDTIMPTAQVVDCASWRNACATINDIVQCTDAQINFKPRDARTVRLIDGACTTSGSVCVENWPVAVSNGACN
ncbi:MAG: hypothetical protein LBK26_03495 [Rickettsiales bacterium]|nr:hypothetical protein [Rickettsiales bacterium]